MAVSTGSRARQTIPTWARVGDEISLQAIMADRNVPLFYKCLMSTMMARLNWPDKPSMTQTPCYYNAIFINFIRWGNCCVVT